MGGHQHAQADRVDELDLVEVDDHGVGPIVEGLGEQGSEPRPALGVELSVYSHDDVGSSVDVELGEVVRCGRVRGVGTCVERLLVHLVHREGRLVVRDARASFPPALTSATDARRFAEKVIDGWELGELREIVRLLVSELVINAVLHACTPVTLSLRNAAGRLLVEVSDGSESPPVRRRPGPMASTGRGLQILTSLSDDWGVDIHDGGKTVWFVLASTGRVSSGGAGTVTDLAEVVDPSALDVSANLTWPADPSRIDPSTVRLGIRFGTRPHR